MSFQEGGSKIMSKAFNRHLSGEVEGQDPEITIQNGVDGNNSVAIVDNPSEQGSSVDQSGDSNAATAVSDLRVSDTVSDLSKNKDVGEKDSAKKCESDKKDIKCGECVKIIKAKACFVTCNRCKQGFCLDCTKLSAHVVKNTLIREDVWYSCKTCLPIMNAMIENTPMPVHDSSKAQAQFAEIKNELSNINGLIKHLEEGVSKLPEKVTTGMKKSWVEALYGEEFPSFDPAISYKQAKDIAKEASASEHTNTNDPPMVKPPSVSHVIKQAVRDQQLEGIIEEQSKNEIRSNIMIYGLEEKKEADYEKRNDYHKEKISELFDTLETSEVEIVKMFRVGKFNENPDADAKPRPLKIVLKGQDEAVRVVKNAKKLKSAPTHLKSLSISHDLTKSEREIIRKMNAKCKEQTRNSPNWDFKVVGPPWKPTIASFRRREAAEAQ